MVRTVRRKTWKEKTNLEDLSVDGRMIFTSVLKEYRVNVGAGFIWLRTETS
jgi:hypothetical protein